MSGKRSRDKFWRYFGNQKHKQDERPGARPPDTWDDRFPGRENYAPHRHAKRLKEKGISREEAILKLMKKWRMEHSDAARIFDSYA